MSEENNLIIIDSSKFIGWLLVIYRTWKKMSIIYSRTSVFMNLMKKIKIGLGGLFYDADWQTIKERSFILRYIISKGVI